QPDGTVVRLTVGRPRAPTSGPRPLPLRHAADGVVDTPAPIVRSRSAAADDGARPIFIVSGAPGGCRFGAESPIQAWPTGWFGAGPPIQRPRAPPAGRAPSPPAASRWASTAAT